MSVLKLKKINVLTFLIFFQWLFYENVFFLEVKTFFGGAYLVIFFLKLFIPFYLFYNTGFQFFFLLRGKSSLYILTFFLLILWAFFPTIIRGDIFSWIKLIPIFVFFLAVCSFFYKFPNQLPLLFKLIVFYYLINLFDYFILLLFGYSFFGTLSPRIIGNTSHLVNFDLTRFYGLWLEPSNASLISFICFFLCRYLYKIELKNLWRYFSYLCLIGGLLCLSSAGFFAFASAVFYNYFFLNKEKGFYKKVYSYGLSFIFLFVILFSLFSRFYFSMNTTSNPYLLSISGIRNIDTSSNYDFSDGRLATYIHAYTETKKNIIGKGLQASGQNAKLSGSSASAPFFWLYMIGFPGLILLLIREFTLASMYKTVNSSNVNFNYIIQCSVCIYAQHSINGNFMNATYVIFSALIIIFYKKQFQCVE